MQSLANLRKKFDKKQTKERERQKRLYLGTKTSQAASTDQHAHLKKSEEFIAAENALSKAATMLVKTMVKRAEHADQEEEEGPSATTTAIANAVELMQESMAFVEQVLVENARLREELRHVEASARDYIEYAFANQQHAFRFHPDVNEQNTTTTTHIVQ